MASMIKPKVRPTPPKAPWGVDTKSERLRRRWDLAFPVCPECLSRLAYLVQSEIWICKEHGEQWNVHGLAKLRGFFLA
jgi:hypothetical protein